MTPEEAVGIAVKLISIGVIIDAAEGLWIRQEFGPSGLFNWQVLRTTHRWMSRRSATLVLDGVLQYPNYLALLIVEIICAAVLLGRTSTLLLCIVLAVRLLSHLRNQYGLDGADQMLVVVLAGCIGWRIAPESWAKEVCIWFVCLQAILSYVTAGTAKAISPVWRSGTAVRDILRTNYVGSRISFQWLSRNSRLSWAACWGTILFECAMPILIFCGPKLCLVFLACGVLFHVSIAITMGLNDFPWAFLATYPFIFLCSVDFAAAIRHGAYWVSTAGKTVR